MTAGDLNEFPAALGFSEIEKVLLVPFFSLYFLYLQNHLESAFMVFIIEKGKSLKFLVYFLRKV